NLMGGAAAVDSGVTAGLSALNACVNSLLAGDTDMMICASGQRRMGIPEYEMLTRNGMLAGAESIRSPLDAQGGKLVPGEGVGVLVLKRLSQARQDGDRIRAIIRGIGAAHGKNWGEALQSAMERSFQRAHVEPSDLAIMEFDGCGTALWNQHELQTVVAVHERYQRRQPLLISSVTSQIGHTEGVSGIASLIKANLELEHGEVPATLGLEQAVTTLAEQPSVTQAVDKAAPIRLTTEDGRRLGGVSSCSRRLAYHLIIERGEKVPVEQQPARAVDTALPRSVAAVDQGHSPLQPVATDTATSAWRICRLGAASVDELLRKLDDPAVQSGALYDASGKTCFAAQDQFRLAVVADSTATCRRKVELARKQLTNPAAQPLLEQQGIFFRQLPASAPRVALVFAGQGSQYTGMLREIVRDVPAAAAAKQEVDALMTRLGHGTFDQLAWDDNSRLGTDVWPTQVSLLLADHIMHRVLADRGVSADLVLGHSYGEYPALLAGGAWDLETAVQVTRARCTGAEMCSDSKLMATTATPEAIKNVNGLVRGDVYVAIQNAPDQLVVGGTEKQLKQLAAVLEAESYKARMLPVPCAFHTPLVEAANRVLEPAVRAARIQRPQIPTYSWVTQRPAVSPEEIRSIVMAHYTTPLWYVDFIRRIAAEASTVFVEVGPHQVLTRLHRQILEGSDVMAVSCDNPKRPGVEQLCYVQALLECVGALKPAGDLHDSHPATAIPQVQPALEATGSRPAVVHFDATDRRREKMRNAATTQGGSPADALTAVEPVSDERVSPAPATVATAADVLPASTPETGTVKSSPAELESFLIDFVVEQTGYPPEVVELDADLEADLGIDSIKKAQLFGELQD
ncbi:MAG: acyltransferase domain-containing protein, partial [Planctomycetota bacterium]|nr:acyltransferase domain-containing protein [Planctomycetota bacterium]